MNAIDERARVFRALADLQQGTYSDKGDIIDASLYDRFPLANARTQIRLFTVGVGQTPPWGGQKTYADTNVEPGQGGIPQGHNLVVRALKLFYTAFEVRTDLEMVMIQNMLRETTITVNITGKDNYGRWTLTEFLGNPINVTMVPAAATGQQLAGTGRFVGILPLNVPIILAALTTFSCVIDHWTAPNAGLDGDFVLVSLNGVLMRLS